MVYIKNVDDLKRIFNNLDCVLENDKEAFEKLIELINNKKITSDERVRRCKACYELLKTIQLRNSLKLERIVEGDPEKCPTTKIIHPPSFAHVVLLKRELNNSDTIIQDKKDGRVAMKEFVKNCKDKKIDHKKTPEYAEMKRLSKLASDESENQKNEYIEKYSNRHLYQWLNNRISSLLKNCNKLNKLIATTKKNVEKNWKEQSVLVDFDPDDIKNCLIAVKKQKKRPLYKNDQPKKKQKSPKI